MVKFGKLILTLQSVKIAYLFFYFLFFVVFDENKVTVTRQKQDKCLILFNVT